MTVRYCSGLSQKKGQSMKERAGSASRMSRLVSRAIWVDPSRRAMAGRSEKMGDRVTAPPLSSSTAADSWLTASTVSWSESRGRSMVSAWGAVSFCSGSTRGYSSSRGPPQPASARQRAPAKIRCIHRFIPWPSFL